MLGQSDGGGSAPNRPDAVRSASSSPQRTSARRQNYTQGQRRGPRRNNTCPKRFQGKTQDPILRKHIFDVGTILKSQDLFVTTAKEIGEYISREYDDAGEFRNAFIDLRYAEVLTEPERPTATDQFTILIWTEEMKEYIRSFATTRRTKKRPSLFCWVSARQPLYNESRHRKDGTVSVALMMSLASSSLSMRPCTLAPPDAKIPPHLLKLQPNYLHFVNPMACHYMITSRHSRDWSKYMSITADVLDRIKQEWRRTLLTLTLPHLTRLLL